jgi:hypothetical protein
MATAWKFFVDLRPAASASILLQVFYAINCDQKAGITTEPEIWVASTAKLLYSLPSCGASTAAATPLT